MGDPAPIATGETTDYSIRGRAKLRRIAAEVGWRGGQGHPAVARTLADTLFEDFGFKPRAMPVLPGPPAQAAARDLEMLGITPAASTATWWR
jgi:hypothetical protein